MRERLVALKLQRDQIAKEIGELQIRMATSPPHDHSGEGREIGVL